MMLDRDLLIRKVAEKHKIIIDENDPVLATLALHDVILSQYAALIDAAILRLEKAVLETTVANTALLRQQTEQTLGQAIFGLKKVLDTATAEIRTAAGTPVKLPETQPGPAAKSPILPLATVAILLAVVTALTTTLILHH